MQWNFSGASWSASDTMPTTAKSWNQQADKLGGAGEWKCRNSRGAQIRANPMGFYWLAKCVEKLLWTLTALRIAGTDACQWKFISLWLFWAVSRNFDVGNWAFLLIHYLGWKRSRKFVEISISGLRNLCGNRMKIGQLNYYEEGGNLLG